MAIIRGPIGDPGLNEFAQNTNRTVEHLTELQGREGSIKYRQMSRGDGTVGMILKAHKNPLRSCKWCIEAPDDATPQEQEAVDALKAWFFKKKTVNGRMVSMFDTLFGQILSMLEYGFSVFEMYWALYPFQNNKYLMPVLDQRMQTSIQDILPKDQKIRQITIEKGLVDIPFDQLVFFVLNQQGEDFRGESILRTAYADWKRKKTYQSWQGIGIQRSTSGLPHMVVPSGTDVTSKEYLACVELLQNITFHERAYMITEVGYEFKVVESKFNAEQVQKAIDGCNSEMTLSVLAQFILLGQNGNTGAFALSRDQSDFFLDGLEYIVTLICSEFNASIIAPFLKLNFGESVDPERIQIKGLNLNKKAGSELAETLTSLKTSGFIKPTADDEVRLRQSLDMPALTKEEVDKRRDDIDNPPGVPPITDPNNPPAPGKKLKDDTDPEDEGKPVKLSEKETKRKAYLDKTIKEVQDFMQANLLQIKDKLMADIESTLDRGTIEIQGLKKVEVSTKKYLEGMERKLAGIAVESWNMAKKEAKLAIKLAEDKDPKEIKDKTLKLFIQNEAQAIVDSQVEGMKARAIITASKGPLKGYSVTQTMANVDKAIDAFITSNGVVVSGSLVSVDASNFGASQFYKEIEDQLWGYRFVGIDDDVQSDICKFYDGKTYSIDSPELSMATPPLHPNCRSHMEPIYRNEQKPDLDNVIAPPSIQKQKTLF